MPERSHRVTVPGETSHAPFTDVDVEGAVSASPTRKSHTEARGRETRQRIVMAVWDVLAEHGYAGMTVRLVGQRAGVSHAMIHYYFTGKDDLLLAVVEYARGNWIHPLEDWVFGAGSSAEKLENIIVWMAEPATRDVMRVHRQLLSQTEWNEDLRQAMATEYARWRAGFVDLFRQLDADGLLSPETDIHLLGAAFSTASDSLVSKRALEPTLDSEAIMREMLRPFLLVPVIPVIGGASSMPAEITRG
jgi:AcrR family transcriptional regulator